MSKLIMSDADVMAEQCVYRHLGVVYYKHESGEVFSIESTRLIYKHLEAETGRRQTLPTGALPWDPRTEAQQELVDEWTDHCDGLSRRNPAPQPARLVGLNSGL